MSSTERFSRPQAKKNPDFSLIGFPSPKVKKVKTIGREIGEVLRDFLVVCNKFREAERQKQEAAVKYAESIGVYEWMSPELKAQMIMLAAIRETFSPKPIAAAIDSASNGALPKAEEQLVAELYRNHPDMKESEVIAHLKPFIASKFKRPEAKPKKARLPSNRETTLPERIRIYQAWRELLSNLGHSKRATPKECMDLVRAERPQADSALVKKIMGEVYEYNR